MSRYSGKVNPVHETQALLAGALYAALAGRLFCQAIPLVLTYAYAIACPKCCPVEYYRSTDYSIASRP